METSPSVHPRGSSGHRNAQSLNLWPPPNVTSHHMPLEQRNISHILHIQSLPRHANRQTKTIHMYKSPATAYR